MPNEIGIMRMMVNRRNLQINVGSVPWVWIQDILIVRNLICKREEIFNL
jgi:hypothetical protein